jgi:hypothetical protein
MMLSMQRNGNYDFDSTLTKEIKRLERMRNAIEAELNMPVNNAPIVGKPMVARRRRKALAVLLKTIKRVSGML